MFEIEGWKNDFRGLHEIWINIVMVSFIPIEFEPFEQYRVTRQV